jgi:AraC family transcriptional regulator
LAIEGLASELFACAARALDPREPRPPRWLTRAQEYVHARFREAPQLGEIARAVDVHPVRLARAFRSHHGVSIGRYVRRLRLDWAAVQLAATGVPLSVVALRAGFADQSHFTRAFRRQHGVTPQRYRSRAR